MRFFDTHAHYTDERFSEEYPGGADALLPEVFASGVEYIVNAATNVKNSAEVIAQAKKYPGMFAAVGIHPEDCPTLPDIDGELAALTSLLENRKENKIVAVGEIGLDYYWDKDHKELQKEYLDRQLGLAERFSLPAVIHDREAHGDCFEAILRHPKAFGVLHSFSGSAELALEYVKRGWYISFSGVVSFKNARKTREVAAVVPEDRMLIETDCPYLAPEPNRGKLNRSDYLVYTLSALAEAKQTDKEALGSVIFENSRRIFGV